MKCENCGNNEVSFVYRSNVNGTVTEAHLCSGCAEKLGYTQKIQAQRRHMQRSFDRLFGGSIFELPFGRVDGSWLLEDPFEDFFSTVPVLGACEAEKEENQKQPELVNSEEQNRFSRMRQMNALRLEMKKAVRQENFERAAELRDEIRALESRGKENN